MWKLNKGSDKVVQVKNLLHQPLVLDTIRFNARETKEVSKEFLESDEFKKNKQCLKIITQPKTSKQEKQDMKPNQEKAGKTNNKKIKEVK